MTKAQKEARVKELILQDRGQLERDCGDRGLSSRDKSKLEMATAIVEFDSGKRPLKAETSEPVEEVEEEKPAEVEEETEKVEEVEKEEAKDDKS